ncbi:DUF6519 domain-containing protein [Teredinibacter purpureus]|uniref:DUF6519 domain-containing protein n=1 Tax=Teredinibacter purpureus TaxID=2731756 RepID=UPI0005F86848|nr:DUF6519 domain-containing protein [Teredinibacter purpureus]
MGDFSRDTFQLTNVLYEYLRGETVLQPRHYTGVRLQQGVPLLDADWNDADDIRRYEVELLLRDIIGNGVPGMGAGFAIEPIEDDNNFSIQPGMLVVDGWQVINPGVILYRDLPRLSGEESDLVTPPVNRFDIVYLDVFEQEVSASGSLNNDERLVNQHIGLETTSRQERRWTVRVAESVSQFDTLSVAETGHKYYPLARLHRSSNPRIEHSMIEDLRRLGLTLSDSVKAPLYARRGDESLSAERFSQMLKDLRKALQYWQQNELFPIVLGGTESWLSYQNVANEIYYLTTAAEVNSDTRNFDNQDALTVLQKLVDAQHALLDVITTFGTGVPSEMSVVTTYAVYLNGNGGGISGIQPAIDLNDVLSAVIAQEELIEFLGLTTGDLPQGSVSVMLATVNIATDVSTDEFQIGYTVTSNLLIPADAPELFDIAPISSDSRWNISLSATQLNLLPGESAQVTLTVDPNDALTAGDFSDINIVARSRRRASIQSAQPAQRFTIGGQPPTENFLFYSGGVELQGDTLVLTRADVEFSTFEVAFTLVNSSSGIETHRFDLEYHLEWPVSLPDEVDPNDWLPGGSVQMNNQNVTGNDALVTFPIEALAPLGGIAGDITFTLMAAATLTAIDAVSVPNGKQTLIELPVRVTAV